MCIVTIMIGRVIGRHLICFVIFGPHGCTIVLIVVLMLGCDNIHRRPHQTHILKTWKGTVSTLTTTEQTVTLLFHALTISSTVVEESKGSGEKTCSRRVAMVGKQSSQPGKDKDNNTNYDWRGGWVVLIILHHCCRRVVFTEKR